MKSKFIGILLCILALLFPLGKKSHASLIDIGGGIIRDDNSGQYWMQDMKLLTNMTYQEQLDAIRSWNANSTFRGISVGNWRMATMADIDTFEAPYGPVELSNAFTPTLITPTTTYSNGRINEVVKGPVGAPTIHYVWSLEFIELMSGGLHSSTIVLLDTECSNAVGAWVTADPVPVPGAVWLIGFGLAGLAAVRRHKQ